MSNQKAFSIGGVTRLVLLGMAVLLLALPGVAQTSDSNYIFLLSSGFLCDPGDSSTCPATAKAAQGDSFEMSGAGTFDAQNKSLKAAGTFTHKSPNGNVLEAGVWLAGELVSFEAYGAAPGALSRLGLAVVPALFGPSICCCPQGPRRQAGWRTSYPPFADIRPTEHRGATSELRVGRCAPRTFSGRNSTNFGKRWQRIF